MQRGVVVATADLFAQLLVGLVEGIHRFFTSGPRCEKGLQRNWNEGGSLVIFFGAVQTLGVFYLRHAYMSDG